MTPPTPLAMGGRRKPRHVVPPLFKRGTAHQVVDGVPMIGRVVEIADQHGHDLRDIAAAVLDAEKSWPGVNGTSRVFLRGDIAAVVPDDTFEVIAVMTSERALSSRSECRDGSIRKARGGGIGTRNPTSMNDLYAAIDAAGLVVARNSKHIIIRHPEKPGQVVAAATPSDQHSIPNAVHEIRRTFGVDLRQRDGQ